jgi:hypothetical protein
VNGAPGSLAKPLPVLPHAEIAGSINNKIAKRASRMEVPAGLTKPSTGLTTYS